MKTTSDALLAEDDLKMARERRNGCAVRAGTKHRVHMLRLVDQHHLRLPK
jgi:hypothetical protein